MSSPRNKRDSGGHGDGEERWLLPYADMITLLLGLFIVLFAMSSIDAKKFDNIRHSLSQTFSGQVLEAPGSVLDGSSGALQPTATSEPPSRAAVQRLRAARTTSQAQYTRQAKEIRQISKQAGLGNDVKVTTNERGIVVSLAGDALFDSGSSELKPSVRDKLIRLERQLQAFNRELEIVGHTDGAPFRQHPHGNWGLGADRANAVLVFFLAQGYPKQLLTSRTAADTEPIVKPPKGNPTASMKANRRIEITVLAPGANDPTDPELKLLDAASGPVGGGIGNPAGAQLNAEFGIVEDLAATTRGQQ